MAEDKPIEDTSSDEVTKQADSAAEEGQAEIELPAVKSVSISPAMETAEPIAPAPEIVAPPRTSRPRPRHRRYALLAASVAIGAAFGVVLAAGGSKPAVVNVAGVEENKAIQQSVARLSKEIANLGAGLEVANKSTHNQIAKINERVNRMSTEINERLNRASAEITGSIKAPQTVPPSAASAHDTPIPTARPASAAADTQPPTKPSIVADWSVLGVRGRYVYLRGHGDIYEAVPGAPLPGLGPVEQIKRQDGRWVVVTPKGIIVSMRDRRYFEQF
ncbi:MAG: hypothetical protein ACM3IH_23400 [Sphingobacteriales bacterium]